MKPNEIYAAAWKGIADILDAVDMDDYNLSDEVIEAIDNLTPTFRQQAKQLLAEQTMIEGVHANLKKPTGL